MNLYFSSDALFPIFKSIISPRLLRFGVVVLFRVLCVSDVTGRPAYTHNRLQW